MTNLQSSKKGNVVLQERTNCSPLRGPKRPNATEKETAKKLPVLPVCSYIVRRQSRRERIVSLPEIPVFRAVLSAGMEITSESEIQEQ